MSDQPDNIAVAEITPELLALASTPAEEIAHPSEVDLDAIETKILDTLEAEKAAPKPAVPAAEATETSETTPGVRGRKPRKEKLTADIEKFRDVCGDIIPAGWKLKKTRVKDLEIILARCVAAAGGHSLRPNTEANPAPPSAPPSAVAGVAETIVAETTVRPSVASRLDAPGLNGNTVAKTLCDMNILAMEVAEFGTQAAAPYTGGVIVSGAAAELRSRADELEDIIRRVYADNKEICDKYVSPTLAWASMMTAVALKNVKKVDEQTGQAVTPQEYAARAQARSATVSSKQSAARQ